MNKKNIKKVSVKLNEGQSVIKADIELLNHVVETYYSLGAEQDNDDDANSFFEAAALFKDSIDRYSFSETVDFED